MQTIVYTHHLEGQVTEVAPGLFDASLRSDGEATLRCQLTFLDEHRFREEGTIDFGDGRALAFRTLGEGHFAPSPDPRYHHGTAMRVLDGDLGRMTSNFLVSADGEVTDDEVAVVFVKEEE